MKIEIEFETLNELHDKAFAILDVEAARRLLNDYWLKQGFTVEVVSIEDYAEREAACACATR